MHFIVLSTSMDQVEISLHHGFRPRDLLTFAINRETAAFRTKQIKQIIILVYVNDKQKVFCFI